MARSKRKGKNPPSPPLPIPHKEGEPRGHYTRWTLPARQPILPDKTPDSEGQERERDPEESR